MRTNHFHLFAGMLMIFALTLNIGTPVRAQNQEPAETIQLTDKAALGSFMDGLIEAYMKEQKAAAAVVSIIHRGEVLYQQGYGYADIENRIPADPETTLFRIGSISKLFLWLAVLQQVELGNLDLDTDINQYISAFRIPDTFDEPVTLRSLMSHTPGFEDVLLHLFMREGDDVAPLEEILRKQMPRRVRPPMQEAAYSNHGTGLAQYLVELASGKPFETYVEQHIFAPLGMHASTFRQPLPPHLRDHMAKGYAWQDGIFAEKRFEIVPMTGAGGASSTAADMTIFMNALMNQVRHDTISLLDSATYAIMKKPALVHARHMNPTLHGFLDLSPAHLRIIGHGGNTFLFHSLLAMFPDHDTGVFLSFSGESAAAAYISIIEHFGKRYFPQPETRPSTIDLDKAYLKGFTGEYMLNRRPHSSMLKIIGYLNRISVEMHDGKLLFTDFMGEKQLISAIDSTTFHIETNNTYVGFYRPEGKKAQKIFFSNFPIMAGERATGLKNMTIHMVLLLSTLLCMLYILIVWPWLYFARKLYEKKPRTRHALPLVSKIAGWISAFFLLVFLLLFLMGAGQGVEIVYAIPSSIKIGLFFPIAAIPFILIMIWHSIYIWKATNIKNMSRLFYNLSTLVFILTILQLHYFHLLGWRF
ncbi:MAG: class A beta-lactamase-related serine hydrolase [Bacteroidia bacterium]|nr:MAG: class A beta-lactamase-related serine hydrolase [Bacteroidia bacterium]